MILFKTEEALEEKEIPPNGMDNPLFSSIVKKGMAKLSEPLHRNKKLRTWPGEQSRKEIYREIFSQQTGLPPSRESIEEWKTGQAQELWLRITANLNEDEKRKVLKEYAVSYISTLVSNTIHLESLYTTLKPIGQKQWEISNNAVKELTKEENLLNLTEKPELLSQGGVKKKVPDWIKGSIIYLSFQGSRAGGELLKPSPTKLPSTESLRTATCWALGTHLNMKGDQKTLEETNELFNQWTKKREKIKLELVRVDVSEIPEEIAVPPPSLEGHELPWGLAWRILPVLEKEIRELADKVLNNENYFQTIANVYKKRLFDRWVSGLARRAYLRNYEEGQSVSERWKVRTLILNPIDNYISKRIMANIVDIRLLAKTEAAWLMLTDALPEPEIR
jgi:hypothetical protein